MVAIALAAVLVRSAVEEALHAFKEEATNEVPSALTRAEAKRHEEGPPPANARPFPGIHPVVNPLPAAAKVVRPPSTATRARVARGLGASLEDQVARRPWPARHNALGDTGAGTHAGASAPAVPTGPAAGDGSLNLGPETSHGRAAPGPLADRRGAARTGLALTMASPGPCIAQGRRPVLVIHALATPKGPLSRVASRVAVLHAAITPSATREGALTPGAREEVLRIITVAGGAITTRADARSGGGRGAPREKRGRTGPTRPRATRALLELPEVLPPDGPRPLLETGLNGPLLASSRPKGRVRPLALPLQTIAPPAPLLLRPVRLRPAEAPEVGRAVDAEGLAGVGPLPAPCPATAPTRPEGLELLACCARTRATAPPLF